MIRTLAAVAAATTVLVVSGCSGSSSDDDSSTQDPDTSTSTTDDAAPQVEPAAGEEISGDGYSYRVPEGWGVPDQEVPGVELDSSAADLQDDDGFADNINVMLSPAGEVTAEEAEGAAESELGAVGAEDIVVQDRVEVAGEETAHVSALFNSGGLTYQAEQYYPTFDGQTYIATFSFSTTVTPEEREEVTGAVLASWTWAE